MKLKNKKTGEIGNLKNYGEDGRIWVWIGNISKPEYRYNSLAELNDEWGDYEEPKEYWYIDCDGEIEHDKDQGTGFDKDCKEIGNYFETEEEAEKAVERLRAWTRLKDKGFEFEKWYTWEKVTGLACFDKGVAHSYYAGFTFRSEDRLEKDEQVEADLDLLFSQE